MDATPTGGDPERFKSCPKCKRYESVSVMFMSKKRDRELKMCERCRISSQKSHRKRRLLDAAARVGTTAGQKRGFDQIDDREEHEYGTGNDQAHGYPGVGGEGAAVVGTAPVVVAPAFVHTEQAQFQALLEFNNQNTAGGPFMSPVLLAAPGASSYFADAIGSLPAPDHSSDDHLSLTDIDPNPDPLADSDAWFAANGGFKMPLSPAPALTDNNNNLPPPRGYVAAGSALAELSNYPEPTAQLNLDVPPAEPFGAAESYSGVDLETQQALVASLLNPGGHADSDATQAPSHSDNDQELFSTFLNSPPDSDIVHITTFDNQEQASDGSVGLLGSADQVQAPSSIDEVQTSSSVNDHQESNGSVGLVGSADPVQTPPSINEVQTPAPAVDDHQDISSGSVNTSSHTDGIQTPVSVDEVEVQTPVSVDEAEAQTLTSVVDHQEFSGGSISPLGHTDDIQTPAPIDDHQELSVGSMSPLGHADDIHTPASVDEAEAQTLTSVDNHQGSNGSSPLDHIDVALTPASADYARTQFSPDDRQELSDGSAVASAFAASDLAPLFVDDGLVPFNSFVNPFGDSIYTTSPVSDLQGRFNSFVDSFVLPEFTHTPDLVDEHRGLPDSFMNRYDDAAVAQPGASLLSLYVDRDFGVRLSTEMYTALTEGVFENALLGDHPAMDLTAAGSDKYDDDMTEKKVCSYCNHHEKSTE
ncbi:hypothetical protein BJY00DRAFT_307094 [Aspergillus carlsbadensis]|nr:hypothetical protein BJY00DRAFT_307094 [Aspergillus carlsbadensis]